MAFTGEPIGADEALAMGLISEIVPVDQLVNRARELASSIAQNPTCGPAHQTADESE